MNQLLNLKWLNLSYNFLTSAEVNLSLSLSLSLSPSFSLGELELIHCLFQGIEQCSQLEELTLDKNLLSSLPLLSHHPMLRWLSAEDNCLSSLSIPSSPLLHLYYLNVSGNSISALSGVEVRKQGNIVQVFF